MPGTVLAKQYLNTIIHRDFIENGPGVSMIFQSSMPSLFFAYIQIYNHPAENCCDVLEITVAITQESRP